MDLATEYLARQASKLTTERIEQKGTGLLLYEQIQMQTMVQGNSFLRGCIECAKFLTVEFLSRVRRGALIYFFYANLVDILVFVSHVLPNIFFHTK